MSKVFDVFESIALGCTKDARVYAVAKNISRILGSCELATVTTVSRVTRGRAASLGDRISRQSGSLARFASRIAGLFHAKLRFGFSRDRVADRVTFRFPARVREIGRLACAFIRAENIQIGGDFIYYIPPAVDRGS